MPTISISLRDISSLVQKKLDISMLKGLLEYAKAEIEFVDGDEVSIKLNDTNLPYLWSVEGLAMLFKGLLGKEKGIPRVDARKSDYKIIVDSALKSIRPYIAAFVAKEKEIDEPLLKQLIQLQEKVSENYGRRRQKLSIGLYPSSRISFPIYYKSVFPYAVKFIPLDFRKEITLNRILEEHPKGIEYAYTLKGHKKYPLLVDSKKNILSFPPIINSATTGRLQPGDNELLFEATGIDLPSLNLATNIFAHALSERGFKIYSASIKYGNKILKTPSLETASIKVKAEQASKMLGMPLKDSEIKSLLEKSRYSFKNSVAEIPSFRQDIMHPCDVIEDIGVAYGYSRLKELPIQTYTRGSTKTINDFIDIFRELVTGLGYQEIMSAILSNKDLMYEKMNLKDFGTVEIENFTSHSFSCVRTWITPILIDVLSKNKHVESPQKIFEQGLVTAKKQEIADYEVLAAVTSHTNATFTEIKQALDYLFRMSGIKYSVEETEHESFISGRAVKVIVNSKPIGFLGEIHPAVLRNFALEMPVAAMEINLTELFESVKK